ALRGGLSSGGRRRGRDLTRAGAADPELGPPGAADGPGDALPERTPPGGGVTRSPPARLAVLEDPDAVGAETEAPGFGFETGRPSLVPERASREGRRRHAREREAARLRRLPPVELLDVGDPEIGEPRLHPERNDEVRAMRGVEPLHGRDVEVVVMVVRDRDHV